MTTTTINFGKVDDNCESFKTVNALVTGDPIKVIYLLAMFDRDGFLVRDWTNESFVILYPAKTESYIQKIKDQFEVYLMRFEYIKKTYCKHD